MTYDQMATYKISIKLRLMAALVLNIKIIFYIILQIINSHFRMLCIECFPYSRNSLILSQNHSAY